MQRNEYLDLRDQYKPVSVKLAVIAESPPDSDLYFYKAGRRSEALFAALTKLAGLDPLAFATKEDGLHEFARRGWILVDATYEPVNKLSKSRRRQIICRDYQLLHADLEQITPSQVVPLLLIKENVCRILEPRLVQDGFNVLNRGVVLPFPSTGQQTKFWNEVRTIPEFRYS